MSDSPTQASNEMTGQLDKYGVRYMLREFSTTILNIVLLLIAAGTVQWLNAWLFTGLILAYQVATMIALARLNPALLNKRGKLVQETTKFFDKVFVASYIPLAFTIPVVAGLDAIRFQWSVICLGLNIVGCVLFVMACVFGLWAMIVNQHFEMTVFIDKQTQQVCSSGPYSIIRHPGYAAEILALLSTPLILNSWFSYLPVGGLVLLFIIRTALEDKTLQQELPSYRDYTQRTRYRLIPHIW